MTASFKFRFKWNCRNNFCLGAAVLPNFHMHSTSHTCLLLLHNVCKVTSSIQSPLQIIHHVFWNKTVLWRIYLSDCWSFDGKWCILRLRFLSIRSFFFFFFLYFCSVLDTLWFPWQKDPQILCTNKGQTHRNLSKEKVLRAAWSLSSEPACSAFKRGS